MGLRKASFILAILGGLIVLYAAVGLLNSLGDGLGNGALFFIAIVLVSFWILERMSR